MESGDDPNEARYRLAAPPPAWAQPGVLETHYSWLRTRLSVERSLLAWMRTSISLIGFGFTIYQFLDKIRPSTAVLVEREAAPRNLGLSLVATGVVAMLFATWRYHMLNRYLAGAEFKDGGGRDAPLPGHGTYLVSALLVVIGVVAFLSILLEF
jgi:putative membrane protein